MNVNLLAALVVEWGRKHFAAPATSAAEFVNAGKPAYEVKAQFRPLKYTILF